MRSMRSWGRAVLIVISGRRGGGRVGRMGGVGEQSLLGTGELHCIGVCAWYWRRPAKRDGMIPLHSVAKTL